MPRFVRIAVTAGKPTAVWLGLAEDQRQSVQQLQKDPGDAQSFVQLC